jgi:16S rRNA (guanine527-N7)-methyltransferase
VTAKRALIDRAASALGYPLDAAAHARVALWLDRLEEWNARIDLTAARTPDALVDLMVADAMVLAPRIAHDARIVDVGAGAGAPGFALALLRTDLRVTLVEPLGKRASFLRTVVGEAGRGDIAIERLRAHALEGRRAWDVAVSRATLPPAAWLAAATTIAAPGGSVWVLLAQEAPPTHARASVAEHVDYAWPLTGAGRKAVRYLVT